MKTPYENPPPRLHLAAPGGWCIMLRLLQAAIAFCRIGLWKKWPVRSFWRLLGKCSRVSTCFNWTCLIQWLCYKTLQIIHGEKRWIGLWEILLGFPNKFCAFLQGFPANCPMSVNFRKGENHYFSTISSDVKTPKTGKIQGALSRMSSQEGSFWSFLYGSNHV